jgi:hypothetical protein
MADRLPADQMKATVPYSPAMYELTIIRHRGG